MLLKELIDKAINECGRGVRADPDQRYCVFNEAELEKYTKAILNMYVDCIVEQITNDK